MSSLTLGTAQITICRALGTITVRYMNEGSFLIGEQTYGATTIGEAAAISFCRTRSLRVL